MAKNSQIVLPSGDKLPAIGLGTYQSEDEKELSTALDAALESGYRHIDTAYLYNNEQIIGKTLKKWFDSGKLKREDIFITTKLPPAGVHPDRVEYFLNDSLKNLQLGYIDLFLIHLPVASKFKDGQGMAVDENGIFESETTDLVAVWKKLEEQVNAGKTKNIGVSNFSEEQISKILKVARIKPANLQVELHIYLQQPKLVDFCKHNGISVVAYCPLGSPGHNVGITKIGGQPVKLPAVMEDIDILRIAKKHNKTPAQVILRFFIDRQIVPVPKSVTPKRIKENFDVFDFKLDKEDIESILKLDQGEKARIVDFKFLQGVEKHPEYPFKHRLNN